MADLWEISTSLNINYNVKYSNNLLSIDNKTIAEFCSNKRAVIVIDKKVNDLYGITIRNYFNSNNIEYHIVIIDGIESNKNLDNLIFLLKEMEQFGISRKNEPIIGIGGGVILDIVGLAANLYRRGIPYIRIPTTLLGIVDVSIAAKTGINFENRRNRLGSYYPPIASLLDKSFIKTLEPIEISSGLGEVLKMAVIKDYHLFEILENYGTILLNTKFDCKYADEVISLSIQGMKEELEGNLWEQDLKRIVDFGHSFSPIIEMRSLNKDPAKMLTHGQAVVLDIILSCVIALNRKMLSRDDVIRIIKTARKLSLPTYYEDFADPLLLFESLQDIIKHRNGDQNLPIPISIGNTAFINNLTYDEIVNATVLFNSLNKELDEK